MKFPSKVWQLWKANKKKDRRGALEEEQWQPGIAQQPKLDTSKAIRQALGEPVEAQFLVGENKTRVEKKNHQKYLYIKNETNQ